MNKKDKIEEGQVQLDDKNNYLPLETSMVRETFNKVQDLINELQRHNPTSTIWQKRQTHRAYQC